MKPKYFIAYICVSFIILFVCYLIPKYYGVDLAYLFGILVGMTLSLGNYE